MDEFTELNKWIDANQDKQGTLEYVTKADRLRQMFQQPEYSIDFNADVPAVRSQIQALPEEQQQPAYNRWGDAYVANENKTAGVGRFVDDVGRAVARGTPVGSWLDELTAKTNELRGVAPYGETLAYQQARDRDFTKRHPNINVVSNLTGAIAGTPVLRGAGYIGNLALNSILGGIYGAGEGNDTDSRIRNAGVGAGLSGLFTSLAHPMGDYLQRYARSNITPAVQAAADRLGITLPNFVLSADPSVRAAGRRTAQVDIGGPVDQAYAGAREQLGGAANQIVQTNAGAPRAIAPNVAGQAVSTQLTNRVPQLTGDIAQIANDINAMIPPGVTMDPAATRAALQNIISGPQGRLERGFNPAQAEGGQIINQAQNISTRPGGVSWPAASGYLTDVGREIGQSPLVAKSATAEELGQLYTAMRSGDQPAFVSQVAPLVGQQSGPQAAQQFAQRVADQHALADLRRAITGIIGERGDKMTPEQMINFITSAAQTSKGGTNLGELATVLDNIPAATQQQAGGGVLANIINNTAARNQQGVKVYNPGAVADAVSAMEPGARGRVFPGQMGGDVDALTAIGERLAAMNAPGVAHTGSAQSGVFGRGGRTGANFITNPAIAAAGGYLAHTMGQPVVTAALLAAAAARQAKERFIDPHAMLRGFTDPQVTAGLQTLYGGGQAASQFATPYVAQQVKQQGY